MESFRKHWLSGVIGIAVLVFLYVPIIYVFVNSFNASKRMRNWDDGATIDWFVKVLTSDSFHSAFIQSITIALIVTVISVGVALFATLGIREFSGATKTAQRSFMFLRLTLPEVILVSGVMIVIHMIPGLSLGPLWVVLVQSLIYGAYAMVVIQARLSIVADLYENAAYDLGASTWVAMKTVILPLLAPAIFVGALLAFTFSLDAVVSVVFLGGATTETLPILIMSMLKRGVTPEVNAMGVIVTLFNLLVLAVAVKSVGVKRTVAAIAGE
ncbi:MAG: ABC transporter permease [Coriobacteriales bacterium]